MGKSVGPLIVNIFVSKCDSEPRSCSSSTFNMFDLMRLRIDGEALLDFVKASTSKLIVKQNLWVGGSRSKERDRKSELVFRSTYQIFEWDRNNSDRKFYNVVRYVHIPLVPWMQERSEAERSGATCHMAIPQCCYLATGAKRPSHTTNTIKFDRIPFDPCNSIKRFDLCPFDQKNSTYFLKQVG